MPALPIEFANGVCSSADETRTPAKFARVCQGVWFKPNDPDRLWALPASTPLGTLPSATNVKDFCYFKYSVGDPKLVAVANSTVYEATAAKTALGTWTQALLPTGGGVVTTGSRYKFLHDGWDRWLLVSDNPNERPLVRDVDGHWRYLGLRKPAKPGFSQSADAITVAPTTQRLITPGTYQSWTQFTNVSNAYDADSSTYAKATASQSGGWANSFAFSEGGGFTTIQSGDYLSVIVEVSGESVGTPTVLDVLQGLGGSSRSNLFVLVSTDGGTTYKTVYACQQQLSATLVQYPFPSADVGKSYSNVKVAISFHYTIGTETREARVYDIRAQRGASDAPITAGTYFYCTTEVWKKTLSDNSVVAVESPPSDVVTATADGTNVKGFQIHLPGATNLPADGCAADDLSIRIYRSTSTGTFPMLGLVGEVPVSTTTFTDNFTLPGTTLGMPLPVVTIDNVITPMIGTPPSLIDACLWRGAIVGISNTNKTIRYSMPGQPDYWPNLGQELSIGATETNDPYVGIDTVADAVVVFTKTKVFRVTDLPFVSNPDYSLGNLKVDELEGTHGLASRNGYCKAKTLRGDNAIWWVSDNGIYFSDGFLPSERGYGAQLATTWLDWEETVDVSKLDQARLAYDPTNQMLTFDFWAKDGAWKTLFLHVSPHHWIQGEGVQASQASYYGSGYKPKITGPNVVSCAARTFGVISNAYAHWGLSSTGAVTLEMEGIGKGDIYVESPWMAPAGAGEAFSLTDGVLYHSNWSNSAACDVLFQTREEHRGTTQTVSKCGLDLRGNKTSPIWINRSGDAFRVMIRHQGLAEGAFGPIVVNAEE